MMQSPNSKFVVVEDVQPNNEQERLIREQRVATGRVLPLLFDLANSNPEDRPTIIFPKGKSGLPTGWQHTEPDRKWVEKLVDSDLSTSVGVFVNGGLFDIDLDSSDPEFCRVAFAALKHCGVDTRFAFRRSTDDYPSHVLLVMRKDDAEGFNDRARIMKGKNKFGGAEFEAEIRHFSTGEGAMYTNLPGSRHIKNGVAVLRVWSPHGELSGDVTSIIVGKGKATYANPKAVKQAWTFGQLAYMLKDIWTDGNRHMPAIPLLGYLARQTIACAAEQGQNDAIYAFTTTEDLHSFSDFVNDYFGAGVKTKHECRLLVDSTVRKLELNPDARVPGIPALTKTLGAGFFAVADRLIHGAETAASEAVLGRYVYVEALSKYYDREQAKDGGSLEKCLKSETDVRTAQRGNYVNVSGKSVPADAYLCRSPRKLRVSDIVTIPMPPGVGDIGEIVRVDRFTGNPVSDDFEGETKLVINDWRGFPVLPATEIDPDRMSKGVAFIDGMLGLLTRQNPNQIDWIKKWIAWTFRHPGNKQQIAWACVGGMGVGKSFFGEIFMPALIGKLAGKTTQKSLKSDFVVGPFIGKLFVFVDEANFRDNTAAMDEVKKLIRSASVAGTKKNHETCDHDVFARIMFVGNRHISVSDELDRGLFYTRAEDAKHKGIGPREFEEYAGTLKPFYDQFDAYLKDRENVAHLMAYFMGIECARAELESLKHSSSTDADIVYQNMPRNRRIALELVAFGSGIAKSVNHRELITCKPSATIEDWARPFTLADLNDRMALVMGVGESHRTLPDPWSIARELEENLGVIKHEGALYRFIHHRKTTEERISQATGMTFKMHVTPGDDEIGEIVIEKLGRAL